jgi:probable HAF family extracellular repeat protein
MVVALSVGLGAWTSIDAQSLTWLGTLGGNASVAYGVSDNGTVVGMARNALGQQRAFRWQCGGPMVDLGTLGGPESIAYDISADGSTIVGTARISNSSTTWQAFKYQSGVMTNLGSLVPLSTSVARSVSADGSVIVGYSSAYCPGYVPDPNDPDSCITATFVLTAACRWTASGITQVGSCYRDICMEPNADVGWQSYGYGVSKDGSTWVGAAVHWDTSHTSGNYTNAVTNNGYGGRGWAYASNQNGSVAVGQSYDEMCFHPGPGDYFCNPAYRWPGGALTATSGNEQDPPPSDGIAFGVNSNATWVVGTHNGRAVRWKITGPTPAGVQEQDLNVVYAALVGNSLLKGAYDISSNGRYIVGVGYNAATQRDEAFLLDTWQSCPYCLPYTLVLGDRDLQRGALRFNPQSDQFSVVGGCQPAGTRFYYGLDVHPQTGEIWACDILANRIVRLSPTGNCLQTIPMPSGANTPTGLAIHPGGRYLHVTSSGNRIDAYDMDTGQWVATTFVPNVGMLYGLHWIDDALYVCDFGNRQLLLLVGSPEQPLSELGRTQTSYSPYDVTGYRQGGGRAPADILFLTQTSGFYGSYSEVSMATHAWDTPGSIFGPYTFAPHPGNNNADGGGSVSFFGITIDPTLCMLWVSDYVRGDLFSVDLQSAQVFWRGSIEAGYKLGVGIALQPKCIAHSGDVDDNGCVDDADLLAVLFAFGTTGQDLGRVDVNCDGTVDDADLLLVLFNFGSGC